MYHYDQVKAAYLKLGDEREKKAILMNIDFVETESIKDRKKLLSKGVCVCGVWIALLYV